MNNSCGRGTVLGTQDTVVNKIEKSPALKSIYLFFPS